MKGTCVEGTIPKLFRGKMVVRDYQFKRMVLEDFCDASILTINTQGVFFSLLVVLYPV